MAELNDPMQVTDSTAPVVDLARRFGGLDRLYGVDGAARIRLAHVAVVGIGGVGSWAVEALARSGVGRLTLVDMDHISESNVNRQIHALTDTLGRAKVLAMKERIAQTDNGLSDRRLRWKSRGRERIVHNTKRAIGITRRQIVGQLAFAVDRLNSRQIPEDGMSIHTRR